MANKIVIDCTTGELKVVKTTKAEDSAQAALIAAAAQADLDQEARAISDAALLGKLKAKSASSADVQDALARILGAVS